jgi:uncharacterized tellurite resistance protein B-like protein
MFGRWLKSVRELPPSAGAEEIPALVRNHLSGQDEESLRVVTAIAGLLGAVAYADRAYTELEDRHVRRALERIHGMTVAGVETISEALRRHAVLVTTVELPRYARDLREFGDTELRRDVLEALVELAAVDGSIESSERNLLRHITTAIGLSQLDYNLAQERFRDRISVLKSQQ